MNLATQPGLRLERIFILPTQSLQRTAERTESRYLALKAISQGYAVLAPEAEESVAGDLDGDGKQRWNVPLSPGKVDLQSLNALLDG